MQIRWLGMTVVLAVSCTPAPMRCPQGCLDSATNTCRSGSEASFCGSAGAVCAACGFGQVCTLGTCLQPVNMGSGGGTANGGGSSGGGASGGGNAGGGDVGGGSAGGSSGGGSTGGGSTGGGSTGGGSTGGGSTGGGSTGGGSTGGGSTGGGSTGGGSSGGGTAGGGTAVIGSPCIANVECSALGSGAYCRLQTTPEALVSPTPPATAYPHGFCTKNCPANSCPSGSICAGGPTTVPGIYNETATFCLPECFSPNTASGCANPNFYCYKYMTSQLTPPIHAACWQNYDPLFSPPFTGGGTPNKLGSTCSSNADCISPPDPAFGGCLLPSQGYLGGYCTATASDADDAWCGTSGARTPTRLSDGGVSSLCFQRCSGPGLGKGTLRTGYTCRHVYQLDGGTNSTVGAVLPACDSPSFPTTCASLYAGTACNTTTGYCCSTSNPSLCAD